MQSKADITNHSILCNTVLTRHVYEHTCTVAFQYFVLLQQHLVMVEPTYDNFTYVQILVGMGFGTGVGVGTDGLGPGVSVGVGAGLPNALDASGLSAEELEAILRRNEDEMVRLRLSWEVCPFFVMAGSDRTLNQSYSILYLKNIIIVIVYNSD